MVQSESEGHPSSVVDTHTGHEHHHGEPLFVFMLREGEIDGLRLTLAQIVDDTKAHLVVICLVLLDVMTVLVEVRKKSYI